MRILFIITKGRWGGAQRYVYDLAGAAAKAGHEVCVAYGESGALTEKLSALGIATKQLPGLARDLGVTRDFRALSSLRHLFREFRPDITHINSSKAGVLGTLAAYQERVPRIVFTAHGWPFLERRNLLWRLTALLGSWSTALFAHAVIVVSKNDLRIGKRMPFCGHKMHLIYNGITLPTLGSGEIIRSAFPKGVTITGTIGELTKNKNQMSLLERAKYESDLYVAIVGEGEERANLEAYIRRENLAERVKLFGFMSATDVLRGFDTFALPSTKEGLPYVLLEAKAAGLPIVATRVGGVGEILDASDMSLFTLERMVRETFALYQSAK